MKKKLLLILALAMSSATFAQFTTGVVTLTGSTRTLKIDTDATTVTMTLTGPSTAWLGVGFGGTSMSTVSDMFIWNATADRDYIAPGARAKPLPDVSGSQSWTITSDNVVGATRTVVATRTLATSGDYTFLNDNSTIPVIFAEGSTTTLAYHSSNPHAAQALTRTALGIQDFTLNASTIYPNPSQGDFTVLTKTSLNTINVYTQTGVFVKTIKVDTNSDHAAVNVKGLSRGIYLIELQNNSDKSWKKVLIN